MIIPVRQKNILHYKDIHRGQTCCIFATGPSINETKFEGLESFVSFGCNSFYNHWFKTDYFCVTDDVVWQNHKEKISRIDIPVFKTNKESKKNFVDIYLKNEFVVDCKKDYGEIDRGIYRGHTVVNHILQIAFWMGFKTVFLFGCDCNYWDLKCHFDGTPIDNINEGSLAASKNDWKDVFEQYEASKRFYEADNRKIYNATSGGRLEVFERKKP